MPLQPKTGFMHRRRLLFSVSWSYPATRFFLAALAVLPSLTCAVFALEVSVSDPNTGDTLEPFPYETAWCGPRAVYAICRAEGMEAELATLTKLCACDSSGQTTLANVEKALWSLGMFTAPINMDFDCLVTCGLRGILLFREPTADSARTGGDAVGHCVAFLGRNGDRAVILNPRATPMVRSYSYDSIRKYWSGDVILTSRRPITLVSSWTQPLLYGLIAALVFSFVVGLGVAVSRAGMTSGFILKRRLSAAIAAVIVVLGGAIAILVLQTNDKDNTTETPASQRWTNVLKCTPDPVDLGRFVAGEKPIEFKVTVENPTKETVSIRNVRTTCACIRLEDREVVLSPGESVSIPGAFISAAFGRWGPFEFSAMFAGGQAGDDVLLRTKIKGMVIPSPRCAPAEVIVEANGVADSRMLACYRTGYGNYSPTPAGVEIKCDLPGITTAVASVLHIGKTSNGGWCDIYGVQVTGLSSVTGEGSLTIAFGNGTEEVCRVPIRRLNKGYLQIRPAYVFLSDTGQPESQVRIRRTDGVPFALTTNYDGRGGFQAKYGAGYAAENTVCFGLAPKVGTEGEEGIIPRAFRASASTESGRTEEISIPVVVIRNSNR